MRTLSQKVKSVMTDKDLSYREVGRLVNLAHSTIYQVVVKGKTALKSGVRNKLVKLSTEINTSDFTEIKKSNVSRAKRGYSNLQPLLKQYDSSKLMKVKELKELYK